MTTKLKLVNTPPPELDEVSSVVKGEFQRLARLFQDYAALWQAADYCRKRSYPQAEKALQPVLREAYQAREDAAEDCLKLVDSNHTLYGTLLRWYQFG